MSTSCSNCGQSFNADAKFCSMCGASLGPVSLHDQLRSLVRDELRDRSVVEMEIAAEVSNRLVGWAKTLGFFVGVPLSILVLVLGALGIREYSDVSKKLQSARGEAEELRNVGTRLRTEYGQLQSGLEELTKVRTQVEQLSKDLQEVQEVLRIEPSAGMTPKLRRHLAATTSLFRSYLLQVGYKIEGAPPSVSIDPTIGDNAFFDIETQRISLSGAFAEDADAVRYVYAQYVLAAEVPALVHEASDDAGAIFSALCDYYTASFTNDPVIGSRALRDLRNKKNFDPQADLFSNGAVWGAVLWKLRGEVTPEQADDIVFRWSRVLGNGKNIDARQAAESLAVVASVQSSALGESVERELAKRGVQDLFSK